jgi:hypothetical protein
LLYCLKGCLESHQFDEITVTPWLCEFVEFSKCSFCQNYGCACDSAKLNVHPNMYDLLQFWSLKLFLDFTVVSSFVSFWFLKLQILTNFWHFGHLCQYFILSPLNVSCSVLSFGDYWLTLLEEGNGWRTQIENWQKKNQSV